MMRFCYYVLIIILMGVNQARVIEPPKPIIVESRELTNLERWNLSEHSQQDLLIFLQNSSGWIECSASVSSFLRSITNRQKYQNCVSIVIDYFKRENSNHGCTQNERKELYLFYLLRLTNSFFIVEEFHEGGINVCLKPKQKLLFLYEYYSLNEDLLNRALYFNYPSIFMEFSQFVADIIEKQVLITNTPHFLRFIIQQQKIIVLRQAFEEISVHLPRLQYEKSVDELRLAHDMKHIYMSGAVECLKYDNADMAASIMSDLLRKGYDFSEKDFECYLKIQLYSMFLYSLGKLSLEFQHFQKKSIVQIINFFYQTKNIEDTPLLSRCFDIFGKNASEKRRFFLLQFCFSADAHISVLIRLLEHRYVQLTGSSVQFAGISAKVIGSRCEIGRYSDHLVQIVQNFEIEKDNRQKMIKLLKVVECMHTFGLDNVPVQEIYPVVYGEAFANNSQKLMLYQQSCLALLKQMIQGFIKQQSTILKKVIIEGREHKFQKLYDFLTFLNTAKGFIAQNAVNDSAIHHLLFSELINNGYYQQIEALLRERNMKTYGLSLESLEILIIDHIIQLLTTKRFRSVESTVILLMNILNLSPKNQVNHFIAAYYKYFKYLDDKDISMPPDLKAALSINHLYHISDNYTSKLDTISFDYLFSLLSCIQQHYTDTSMPFSPVITDQFLKFKVHLSNKFFDLKKIKQGNQMITDVLQYQPPWLSIDLVNILRQNPNLDQNFINIAFAHCSRGQDLEFILKLYSQRQAKDTPASVLSLKNIKKLNEQLTKQQVYVCLDDQLILNEVDYANLIAELTYSRNEQFKQDFKLFFRLLSTEPERAFNYAVNYTTDNSFVFSFLMEAVRRNVIHLTRILPLLVRYFYFKLEKESRDHAYIKYKEYLNFPMKDIIASVDKWQQKPSANVQILTLFRKSVKNYQASLEITADFLSLYIKDSQLYRFIYDEGERKRMVLEIRQQPMSKTNAKVFRQLCEKMSIDIVDLSLYELIGRVNSQEAIDDESWNIVQKLISWGDSKAVALKILKKLSQKIETLDLLVKLCGFLKESELTFNQLITDIHLGIMTSLAAVEQAKNLFGIIPDNFFEREISVYPHHPKGVLSETHRRILEQSGALSNIFVLAKALYFMYGCDEEVEKVVLGEFSLKQEDSEEFELLRKKIKYDASS